MIGTGAALEYRNWLGQLTRSTEDVGGIGRHTDSGYDRAGRLARLTGYPDGTSGAQHTVYAYNKAGLQTRVTYPDDTSGGGSDRGFVDYAYDAALRVTRINDQNNENTDIAYDAMGRRLTVTKGTEIDTYGYSTPGMLTLAQRGTSGNPDATSKVDRLYDALLRLTRESQSIKESTARHVDYAYDKAANVLTLTYPSGVAIATSYDARNRGDVIKQNGSHIPGCISPTRGQRRLPLATSSESSRPGRPRHRSDAAAGRAQRWAAAPSALRWRYTLWRNAAAPRWTCSAGRRS